MSSRPLDDVVVVALEQALAVPFATRQLADLGARVIKVERPETGDFARGYDSKVNGVSSAFTWLNRGKESIALDIKSPEDRAVLDRLIAKADVFLHNISPAAAARAGLDSTTLRAKHPNLIAGSVSGYGDSGPMRNAKAYDLLVQAETGLLSITGTEEHLAKVGVSIADIAAGMYVYSSVLAALRQRDRTGEALPVNVSLFDSLTEWLGYPLLYTEYGGSAPPRSGTNHATIAPYGAFATSDGHQVMLAVQNPREWSRLCSEVIDLPELIDDPRYRDHEGRVTNRVALDEVIGRVIGGMTQAEVLEKLVAADIAHSRLNNIEQLATHEQIVERNRWIDTEGPTGTIRTLLPPWVPENHEHEFGGIPEVGAHTAQIREWLGVDAVSAVPAP